MQDRSTSAQPQAVGGPAATVLKAFLTPGVHSRSGYGQCFHGHCGAGRHHAKLLRWLQSTPFNPILRSFSSGMFLIMFVAAAGSSRQGLLRIGTLLSYPQATRFDPDLILDESLPFVCHAPSPNCRRSRLVHRLVVFCLVHLEHDEAWHFDWF